MSTSLLDVDSIIESAEQATKLCCVMAGSHLQYADVGNRPVGEIRRKFQTLFNIPDTASALIKGERVDESAIISPGQTLEFVKESGSKGLGDLMTASDLMKKWNINEDQYEELLKLGLPKLVFKSGVFHAEVSVDEWFRCMASNDTAPRNAEDNSSTTSPFLDSDQAAVYLGISRASLYRLVETRQMDPMRGPKRSYRFTIKMLDEYLNRGA